MARSRSGSRRTGHPRPPRPWPDLGRLQERLGEVLSSLRPALRAAFEQAVLRQKPYSEVAREQGWTLQQVRVNVYRARKEVIARLRHLLSPFPEYRT